MDVAAVRPVALKRIAGFFSIQRWKAGTENTDILFIFLLAFIQN